MKRKRDTMVQFLEIPEARNRGTVSEGRSYRQQNTGTASRFVNNVVSGGSKGSPRDVRPPLGPNSFIFMPFFCKKLPVCAPNGRKSKTHQHLPRHRTHRNTRLLSESQRPTFATNSYSSILPRRSRPLPSLVPSYAWVGSTRVCCKFIGGSKGAPGTRPLGPNSFIFMQFSAKICKLLG